MTIGTWMVIVRLSSGSVELAAAGRGEKRAEVRRVNQTVISEHARPAVRPGLKDVKSDEWTCPRITGGAGENGRARGALRRSLTILPAAAGNTTGGRNRPCLLRVSSRPCP